MHASSSVALAAVLLASSPTLHGDDTVSLAKIRREVMAYCDTRLYQTREVEQTHVNPE